MLDTKHSESILLLPNNMEYFYGSRYDELEALGTQHWILIAPCPNVSFAAAESHTLEFAFPKSRKWNNNPVALRIQWCSEYNGL